MARQNRKKLFSRCTGPISSTIATKVNRSNEEILICKSDEADEFKNEQTFGKQNLRSKLSNAFTSIILSNNLLSKPKLNGKNNKATNETTSSLALFEETLPVTRLNNNLNNDLKNNLDHNLNNKSKNNCSNNYSTNNQFDETNQLIAHQTNRTTPNSSIHSYTMSNQTSPNSVYRSQTSSNQYSTSVNNTTIIQNTLVNVVCTNSTLNPNLNLSINSASVNKTANTSTINAATSIVLTTDDYTTNTANLNSTLNNDLNNDSNNDQTKPSKLTNSRNLLDHNLNDKETNLIDNLVDNQNSNYNGQQTHKHVQQIVQQEFNENSKNTFVNTNLIENNSDLKLDQNKIENKTNYQQNLPVNQFKNLNQSDKMRSQISSDNNQSSGSNASTNANIVPNTVPKTASCKKMNTLECRRQRDNQCTTLMLIVIVSVFLLTEIPLAITTLLHVTQNILDIYIANYKTLNSTILFTNFFIMLSYPVNFAIYCGMSRQFRETFKTLILNRLLCRDKNLIKKNGRYTTTTNATYSNFECSRSQFRHNSVTNQLITNPSNVLQIKSSGSQQTSDQSTTSNQMLNNSQLEDESTSLSKHSRGSDYELDKDSKEMLNPEVTKKLRKQFNDDRHIRFKINSFELKNCDSNNNQMLDKEKDIEICDHIYSDQSDDQFEDRPPYTETNL